MTLIKRIGFFAIVNILVLTTITITLELVSLFFGVEINQSSYSGLILICAVFGMGGSFISLYMSKFFAKKMMGVQIIEPQVSNPELKALVNKIHFLAKEAGLPKLPEVGVYESPEVNAFATGPSRSNSLVAVSTGLLRSMNDKELEGVLAHEVAHVANGDMVTMALIQGIINTIVMVVARVLAGIIESQMGEKSRPLVRFGLVMVLQIALGFLGSIVVNAFSRWREYRADYGAARLVGRGPMIAALERLTNNQDAIEADQQGFASLKISSKKSSSLAQYLSTHPQLEDRIARLKRLSL